AGQDPPSLALALRWDHRARRDLSRATPALPDEGPWAALAGAHRGWGPGRAGKPPSFPAREHRRARASRDAPPQASSLGWWDEPPPSADQGPAYQAQATRDGPFQREPREHQGDRPCRGRWHRAHPAQASPLLPEQECGGRRRYCRRAPACPAEET